MNKQGFTQYPSFLLLGEIELIVWTAEEKLWRRRGVALFSLSHMAACLGRVSS